MFFSPVLTNASTVQKEGTCTASIKWWWQNHAAAVWDTCVTHSCHAHVILQFTFEDVLHWHVCHQYYAQKSEVVSAELRDNCIFMWKFMYLTRCHSEFSTRRKTKGKARFKFCPTFITMSLWENTQKGGHSKRWRRNNWSTTCYILQSIVWRISLPLQEQKELKRSEWTRFHQ